MIHLHRSCINSEHVQRSDLLGEFVWGKELYALLAEIRTDDYCKEFIFVNNPINSLFHIFSPFSFALKQPFHNGR